MTAACYGPMTYEALLGVPWCPLPRSQLLGEEMLLCDLPASSVLL